MQWKSTCASFTRRELWSSAEESNYRYSMITNMDSFFVHLIGITHQTGSAYIAADWSIQFQIARLRVYCVMCTYYTRNYMSPRKEVKRKLPPAHLLYFAFYFSVQRSRFGIVMCSYWPTGIRSTWPGAPGSLSFSLCHILSLYMLHEA